MKPKRYPYTTKRLSPSTERVNCYIKELETLKLDFSDRGLSEELWKKSKSNCRKSCYRTQELRS